MFQYFCSPNIRWSDTKSDMFQVVDLFNKSRFKKINKYQEIKADISTLCTSFDVKLNWLQHQAKPKGIDLDVPILLKGTACYRKSHRFKSACLSLYIVNANPFYISAMKMFFMNITYSSPKSWWLYSGWNVVFSSSISSGKRTVEKVQVTQQRQVKERFSTFFVIISINTKWYEQSKA